MNINLAVFLSMFCNRQKGILDNFRGIGQVITGVAISLGVGAIVVSSFQGMAFTDNVITGENQSVTDSNGITSSDNVSFTVNNVFKGLEENSETLYWFDKSASSNKTLPDGNYSVTYNSGEFGVESVPDYNSTDGDKFYVDYTYHTKSDSSLVLGDGLGLLQDTIGFMEIAVVMLFGIIFMRYME